MIDSNSDANVDFSTAGAKRDQWFRAIPRLETLPAIVAANLSRFGQYQALVFDGKSYTNVELVANARRLAAVLRKAGVERGDRVVVNLTNCPEIWFSYLACSELGAIIVPTVPALTVDELAFVVSDAQPAAIITLREKAEFFKASPERFRSVKAAFAGGRNEPELMSLIEGTPALEGTGVDVVGPDDLIAIIYTSGTTGKPKGVMLTHRSLCRQACLCHGLYVAPDDDSREATFLMPLPMCHIFGLAVALSALLMGSLMVVMERFDPVQALNLIKLHQLRIVPAVPTMMVRLLATPGAAAACTSVRQWDCGGSAMPVELTDEVERELGGLVTEGWGLSETSSAVAQNVLGVPRKRGSVGLAMPGLELAVRDFDGRPQGPGEPGELLVRGETLMRGYWERPEATANAFTADGFVRTGDMGYVDSDGYCYIIGRKDDLIIRGGENLSPRELEEAILEHPAVGEVAVVGLPDPEWGQIAGAFIVARHGTMLTADDVLAFCRKRLARHKIPGRVFIVAELPRNSTGKVVKTELRRRHGG